MIDVATNLTNKFISEKPVEITLERSDVTPTTAGGVIRNNYSPLPASQIFRIDPQNTSRTVTKRVTADGQEIFPDWLLIGKFDADVERFDQFTIDDRQFQVVFVERKILFQRTVAEIWEYVQA